MKIPNIFCKHCVTFAPKFLMKHPGTETRCPCSRAEITRRDHHPVRAGFRHPNHRRTCSVQTKNRRRKKQNHISHSPCQRQSHPSSQSSRHITQNPSGEKEKVRTKIKQPDFLIVVFSETDNVVFR